MPPPAFKYDPLPTQGPIKIRLIELLPGTGPIKCRLHHVPLHSKRAYEALSYCWGTDTKTVAIEVNGAAFKIRLNLHDALVRLRKIKFSRWLWVDAICINQATDHDATLERTQQVQQMASIYRNAARVVIWLGEQTDPSINTLNVVRELAAYVKQREIEFLMFSTHPSRGGISNFPPLKEKRFVPFLQLIFDNPWFHRMWIIQELSVNKSHVVMYGDDKVKWSTFEASTKARGAILEPIKRLVEQKESCRRSEVEDLAMLFLRHREGMANDPRDKLFALCGLVNGGDMFGTRPDYSKSVEDVFHQFTIRHIKETRTLDLICPNTLTHSQQRQKPSWVVNEAFSQDYDSPSRYLLTWRNKINPSLAPCRATRDSRCLPAFEQNERILITKGYALDFITTIGRPYQHLDASLPQMRPKKWIQMVDQIRIWTSWQRIVKEAHHQRYSRMGFSNDDVFMQTCVAPILMLLDFDGDPGRAFKDYEHAFRIVAEALSPFEKLPTLLTVLAITYHLALLWTLIAVFFRLRTNQLPLEEITEKFNHCLYYCVIPVSRACQGRRIFRTANGHVGMGPASLKTGDCVALIAGASVPVVLRQVGAEWQWLGESYVHSGMAGELWDESKCHEMRIR